MDQIFKHIQTIYIDDHIKGHSKYYQHQHHVVKWFSIWKLILAYQSQACISQYGAHHHS